MMLSILIFVLTGITDIYAAYGKKSYGGKKHGVAWKKGYGGKGHGGGWKKGHGWCKYRKGKKGLGYHGHKKASVQYKFIKDWVDKKIADGGKEVSLAELKKMFEDDKPAKAAWDKLAQESCQKFKEEKKKAVQAALEEKAKKIAQAVAGKAKGAELTEDDIAKAVAEELQKQEDAFLKGPGKKYCKWIWGKKAQGEPQDIKDAAEGKPCKHHHHHGHGYHGKHKKFGGHGKQPMPAGGQKKWQKKYKPKP